MKRTIEPKMLYFGTPVVLISSLNDDGTTNLAAMSSAWWVGRTAMLGMSVNSQTVHNLAKRPECVLNLVDVSMVDAIDRLALLTGRRDVPEYKKARNYRYESDKFAAAGLAPVRLTDDGPLGVAESPIQMQSVVRAIHDIDEPESGLRAMQAAVLATHVEENLLLSDHKDHFDALAWDPLIMKFTEYFAGGTNARSSSLAAGWGMPQLTTAVAADALLDERG
jgi:flavin reductase (DIM6/NTAB) family NADH-FMN oxidoreductase RutF